MLILSTIFGRRSGVGVWSSELAIIKKGAEQCSTPFLVGNF